jgi:hypothetical protein
MDGGRSSRKRVTPDLPPVKGGWSADKIDGLLQTGDWACFGKELRRGSSFRELWLMPDGWRGFSQEIATPISWENVSPISSLQKSYFFLR